MSAGSTFGVNPHLVAYAQQQVGTADVMTESNLNGPEFYHQGTEAFDKSCLSLNAPIQIFNGWGEPQQDAGMTQATPQGIMPLRRPGEKFAGQSSATAQVSASFPRPIEQHPGAAQAIAQITTPQRPPRGHRAGASQPSAPSTGGRQEQWDRRKPRRMPAAAPLASEASMAFANAMPAPMPAADVCPARALFDFIRSSTPTLLRHKSAAADPQFVRMMFSLLDRVTAKDLGMMPEEDCMCLHNHPVPVGFVRIHLGPEASVGIFVAAKGAKIAMHDHPNMYVFGRLLFGRIRLTAYTPEEPLAEGGYSASLYQDDVVGPEPANFKLEPVLANLHELVVLDDFAFLNISLPPYSDTCGRPCTYYTAPHAGMPPGQKAAKGERFKLFATSSGGTPAQGMRYHGPRYRPDP
eukprot:CAMPEP_0170351052 /NCGR_PEP_ID=MMETSP0116_2-20130129/76824_1 /TAXON_ID=400756 /ORGANISM="Durinskia baltica, Strain CSIRO CS-38" /LENGTH=407 /DNA_ID=CAMNT_0010604951 /DNA_START=87 /DNA_END=1311 /DNA_ORIENTATION=+